MILKNAGIICIIVLISILLVGSDLINLFFGIEYEKVFINLIIVYFGIFPLLLAQIGTVYSIIYKEPRKYIIAISFAVITFLVISFSFIPKYASIGCSIATLCSSIVLGMTMYVQFTEKISAYALKNLLKIIFLGLIALPLFLFKASLMIDLILLILFVIIYSIILFKTRILNINEIKEIIEAIRHPH